MLVSLTSLCMCFEYFIDCVSRILYRSWQFFEIFSHPHSPFCSLYMCVCVLIRPLQNFKLNHKCQTTETINWTQISINLNYKLAQLNGILNDFVAKDGNEIKKSVFIFWGAAKNNVILATFMMIFWNVIPLNILNCFWHAYCLWFVEFYFSF